ncbi:MAG: bifunctional glutamate N-acetyltransferase/amino-acid acetyltransferase ArgJ [Candidatus Omnitrophota bacterium]
MKVVPGGVCAPQGFFANGLHCGIKYKNKDLALIYSRVPCQACGVLTQNRVQAAPVIFTRKQLKSNLAQAIIANSGNANCCTGEQGLSNAIRICRKTARELNISEKHILTASTGIIGKQLPVETIEAAIPLLTAHLKRSGSLAAAEAIMTTDTAPKQMAVQFKSGNSELKIGAIAKGCGMLAPNLATMLVFITTDAALNNDDFKPALQEAVDNSFNIITVDGDTSTNDMVLALANGLAGAAPLQGADLQNFKEALNFLCISLAKMLIRDAEGGTKFIEIHVEQAKCIAQAKRVAFKVANSPLVKTAFFGENPNWGRIAASIGAADRNIHQEKVVIYIGKEKVMEKGAGCAASQQRLNTLLKKKNILIKIGLGMGDARATVFTSDLSYKYVQINAEY